MGHLGPIILAFLAFAFVMCVAVGGPILMLACFLFDEFGKSDRKPEKPREEQPAPVLKTTEAGPYTAPSVETTAVDTEHAPSSGESAAVPMPSLPYACWIAFVVLLAIAGTNFLLQELLFSLDRRGTYMNQFFATTAPALAFGVAVALHTAMLPTTLARGLVITLFTSIPWIAIAVTFFVICMA